jgi:hypothetical protein
MAHHPWMSLLQVMTVLGCIYAMASVWLWQTWVGWPSSPGHLLRSWPTVVLLLSALVSGLAFLLRVCLCATELGTAVFRRLLNLSAMKRPRP